MQRNDSPPAPEAFAAAYSAALREYVSGAGEAALTRAYELGRAAAGAGLGILEIAMMHHGAVAGLPRPADGRPPEEIAAQFLAEALSPFEMALRSFQANARLLGLSETLARQNAEIDHARDQLRTILDATTAVIYLKDAEGRYLFVNRQFRAVFRLAADEVIGKTDEEVLPAPVARTLQGGDAGVLRARAPQEVEEVIPSAEGARTYVSLKFPLLDPGGRPYALCCVATDITARKRADEALLQAREALARERQLQRAIEARDQFITVASHELRTPLTSLELQVGSLRRLVGADPSAPVPREKIRAKCDTILRQVERMAGLVNTLIDVGKVTSGRLELCHEPLDLAEVARRAVAARDEEIRRSGSEIALRASRVVGTWDRRSLETAVGHVVANAVKFGAGRPIEVSVLQADGRAVLAVRDHGIGISLDDQRRIFERFERAVSERHFGGFGVGLWVARKAVEANGGTIRVASREGQGAEFTLELPLDPADPSGPERG